MSETPPRSVEAIPVDGANMAMEPQAPLCPHRRWLLAGALLILLGLVLGIFVRGDRVFPGELSLLQWLHQPSSEPLDRIAWWASRLGDAYTGLMAATLLSVLWCAWRGRLDLALFLAVASALRVLNTPLKWFFHSDRPPLDLHAAIELANGLGFPSGHTSGVVLVYGAALLAVPLTLASPAARQAVRIVCLVLMLLIPWSRMRLGVHWPSDVAGGYLFGAGILVLLWSWVGCIRRPEVDGP
jgi:membrane-associated phospholipid phosphatase